MKGYRKLRVGEKYRKGDRWGSGKLLTALWLAQGWSYQMNDAPCCYRPVKRKPRKGKYCETCNPDKACPSRYTSRQQTCDEWEAK